MYPVFYLYSKISPRNLKDFKKNISKIPIFEDFKGFICTVKKKKKVLIHNLYIYSLKSSGSVLQNSKFHVFDLNFAIIIKRKKKKIYIIFMQFLEKILNFIFIHMYINSINNYLLLWFLSHYFLMKESYFK